jgi:hypothetical protein
MYQVNPSGVQSLDPSVARAVRVMYAGAWASTIGIVLDLVTVRSLQARLVTMTNTNGSRLTAAQVAQQEHLAIAALVAMGVVAVGLWVWMARSNRDGKSWARPVATAIFAAATLQLVGDLNGSSALAGTVETRVYGVVVWLIGLAAVILLWQPRLRGRRS